MKVLLAPDKFKGTLAAGQVAEHLAAGLRRADPALEVRVVPVADGGEGTVDAACAAGFDRLITTVTGPLGTPVRAMLAYRTGTAVVELAQAAGLGLGSSPLTATSYGVGELIRVALDLGCRRIVLGLGGSACTDGGAGMLRALGALILDASGMPVEPGGGGLAAVDKVDFSGLDSRLSQVELVLATDVDNPLTDAAAVYGPQKGANPLQVSLLAEALRRWAAVVGDDPAMPGSGAAGGVGYAALAVLGAQRRPGVDVLLELLGFGDAVRGAALVITGEGSLDAQSLRGKAPVGVARAAAGVPVVAVAGVCSLTPKDLVGAGIAAAYALTDLEPDPARCRARPGPLLELTAERIVRDHLCC
ncbi:glycerate kinase [Kutzneria sp. CA-103260]|uniref:glycerate kinase n=1 Tax=Kutzneria sp. CA-103260 TaxID=2802641 RepID=UPI001BA497D1|nr:glycerate kinase [Kutzneria sp. CA-103260]QUQ65036.1 glycerate kinase [Kutzneria sp. CA-103260]